MTINGPWPSAGVNEDNQCEGWHDPPPGSRDHH